MAVATPPHPKTSQDNCTETESARRGGGPQDKALYQCCCGTVFTATVSTSVGCPSCGSGQAW